MNTIREDVPAVGFDGDRPLSIEGSARKTFQEILLADGYTIVENADTRTADIIVSRNNVTYYFEIKSTTKNILQGKYFGSASFTEWRTAFDNPDTYTFVIAVYKNNSFTFYEISPQELLKYSTIPPIVVFFSLRPESKGTREPKDSSKKALRLTEKSFKALDKAYQEQKGLQMYESGHTDPSHIDNKSISSVMEQKSRSEK